MPHRMVAQSRIIAESLERWLYQHFTGWFLFTVMSGGDLVVGRLYGVTALGHYQVAMAIPIMIGIRAMSVIAQISLPTYAMLQKDRLGAMRALSLQMGLTGMAIVPSALATATLAPYLVPFGLWARAWTAAIDPLQVLCLFAIAAAFCSVMAAFHCGANHPEVQTKIWAVMCACYVLMVIPFTMMWDLSGGLDNHADIRDRSCSACQSDGSAVGT